MAHRPRGMWTGVAHVIGPVRSAQAESPWGPRARGSGRSGRRGAGGQAVVVLAASSSPSSVIDVSRILNFWILPVTVIGNSLVYRRYRGIL